jgi:hypothetical protein
MKIFVALIITFTFCRCNDRNGSTEKQVYNESKDIVVRKKLSKSLQLSTPNYVMNYYANWKIDSTDSDFDINSNFIFDSPSDNNFISFSILNIGIDPQEHIQDQIREHLARSMKNGKVTYFKRWGKYEGSGASIRGKFVGIYSGELRIFCHSTDSSAFVVTSQLIASDSTTDKRGLELMESTFTLK